MDMDSIDKKFDEWLEAKELGEDKEKILNEGIQTSRYSVEVNYRTKIEETIDAFAKLALGYVSAGMKSCGYHTKIVFTDKPFRVLVSSRNWDDGEWVGIATFNHKNSEFIIAKGSYNKDRKTVSIISSKKSSGQSASDIVKELRNIMEELKRTAPLGSSSLNPVEMKRGPKQKNTKSLKKVIGPWAIKRTKLF